MCLGTTSILYIKASLKLGIVLELVVDGKGASYLPLKWKTYYYGLSAQLRLIDVAQAKVVWAHHCNQSGWNRSFSACMKRIVPPHSRRS